MRAIAVLLACLSFTVQGRRTHSVQGQAQTSSQESHASATMSMDASSGESNQYQSNSRAERLIPLIPLKDSKLPVPLNSRVAADMHLAGGGHKAENPTGQLRFARRRPVVMDETIIEKALEGKLEEEGAENVFMTETGWATYLDKQGQSYAMNERVSKAEDGYFTPDVFSNPIDNVKAWLSSLKRTAQNPLETAFPTISNDESGARTFGKGDEIKSRTIKPKVKDFDAKKRTKGRGFNWFGAGPSEP